MISEIDLRKLSDVSSKERAFLTVYIEDIKSPGNIGKRIDNIGSLIAHPDEKQIYQENVRLLYEQMKKDSSMSGSYVFFICWLMDFVNCHKLEIPVPDKVVVDSSPFIKPLAEIKDEYEDFAVIVADNEKARVFMVSALKEHDKKVIRGDIKNHVRVGGWSQQRYERRRDKELHHYVQDIIDYLQVLDREHDFSRILMVGAREILIHLKQELPAMFRDKLFEDQIIDLKQDDADDEIYRLFTSLEREEEADMWQKISSRYMSGSLAVMGLKDVLDNIMTGRVDAVLVDRDYRPSGTRCRACGHLSRNETGPCPKCSSEDVFSVDMINEITEWACKTSARIEFADRIDQLSKNGFIAALLRY